MTNSFRSRSASDHGTLRVGSGVMSLGVSSGDLIGSWSLSFSAIAFVTGKAETARLGLAVQIRFFAGHGSFVPDHASIPSDGVLYLAEQLGLDAKSVNHYDFSGRHARPPWDRTSTRVDS